MQWTGLHIAGHDPETEGLGGISLEDAGIIGILPMHRLRLHADLIHAIHRHTFLEAGDVAVTALVVLRVRHLIDAQVFVLIHPAMRVDMLLLRTEVARKLPRLLRRLFADAESFLHHLIGGIQILRQEVTGSLQHIAQIIHVLGGLITRELGRRIKEAHIQGEEIAHGVDVFAFVQTAQDSLSAGAAQFYPGHRDGFRERGHYGFAFRFGGLLGLLRRHVAEVELVDDILQIDHSLQVFRREFELVETPLAFLLLRPMARGAVGVEEGFGRRVRLGGLRAAGGRREQQSRHQKAHAAGRCLKGGSPGLRHGVFVIPHGHSSGFKPARSFHPCWSRNAHPAVPACAWR